MADKKWQLAYGERGSATETDPITEVVRRNMAEREGKKMERQDEIEGLEHKAKVEELTEAGKRTEPASPVVLKPIEIDLQSAEKAAEARAQRAEAQADTERTSRQETEKALQDEKIRSLEVSFSTKLEELKGLLTRGASSTSLATQFEELKTLAGQIGWGPQAPGTGAMPTDIQLQITEMNNNLQLRLEEMKDERSRRDQEFGLRRLEYSDNKEFRKQELDIKAHGEAERTQLMRGIQDGLGRLVGKALVHSEGGPGEATAQRYHVEAAEGEEGGITCPQPQCRTPIFIAPDARSVICSKCHTIIEVRRTPGGKAGGVVADEAEAQ